MFGAGGGGLSASSSATSGDARSGNVGITVGGINTGTQSNTSWMLIAVGLAIVWFITRRGGR
jgi:hypothetical protein